MPDPAPNPPKPLPLTDDQREGLMAVVLDANSMGGGNLNLAELTEWAARAAANGLELWIPTTVLDEWAEHAAAAFDEASHAAGKPRAELRKVGIAATWPTPDRDAVVDHVIAAVRAVPNVVVLDLHPDDAVEALRDQILQRPPGSKKQGTKTGAGDSALLRTVHRHAEEHLDRVVVVTGDKGAVGGMCERLGWPPPVVVQALHVLASALGLLDPAGPDDALALARAIAREMPAGWPNPKGFIDVDGFAPDGVLRAAAGDVPDDLTDFIQDAQIATVDRLIGVADVLVDPDGTRYLAEAYFLCTAVVSTAGYDNDGGTVHEEHEAPNLLLRCRIRAELQDGRLVAFDPGGATADVFARDEYASTLRSALDYAGTALTAVPGTDVDLVPPSGGGIRRFTVGGRELVVTASGDADGWELSADVDGTTAAVLRIRPAGVLRHGREPFVLASEPEVYGPSNPPWQFAADVTEALL